MEIFQNVFIGFVDILGYTNFENKLEGYGIDAAKAIETNMFNKLDTFIDQFRRRTSITWIRYSDGFVFYSQDGAIDNLSEMVKTNCMLLALSLNSSIPLRIAITQNTINIDNADSGTTISGRGWSMLSEIENSLNWMGGFLYLPNYNGAHHETVQGLIQTTYLVIKQNFVPNVKFNPPFKQDLKFSTKNTWFLNWQKCFHQDKSMVDRDIKNWWSQFQPHNTDNVSEEVKEKQKNSIEFADYCRALHQASNLVFHSKRSVRDFVLNPNIGTYNERDLPQRSVGRSFISSLRLSQISH